MSHTDLGSSSRGITYDMSIFTTHMDKESTDGSVAHEKPLRSSRSRTRSGTGAYNTPGAQNINSPAGQSGHSRVDHILSAVRTQRASATGGPPVAAAAPAAAASGGAGAAEWRSMPSLIMKSSPLSFVSTATSLVRDGQGSVSDACGSQPSLIVADCPQSPWTPAAARDERVTAPSLPPHSPLLVAAPGSFDDECGGDACGANNITPLVASRAHDTASSGAHALSSTAHATFARHELHECDEDASLQGGDGEDGEGGAGLSEQELAMAANAALHGPYCWHEVFLKSVTDPDTKQ